jgi:hypothetical protein
MRHLLGIVAAVLFTGAGGAHSKDSGFCSSRTTEAYHSPKCNWGWVVRDPHRVEGVKIRHEPSYHTYSRWMLGDHAYIFAYRDIDQHPEDMVVDIYLASHTHYKLVGSVQHLGEIITRVFTARVTGTAIPDVVLREDCGELECVVVVRFSDETAKQVFSYGDRIIEVRQQPKPAIIATSRIANVVEEFAWDSHAEKFRKIEQHPLRTAQ